MEPLAARGECTTSPEVGGFGYWASRRELLQCVAVGKFTTVQLRLFSMPIQGVVSLFVPGRKYFLRLGWPTGLLQTAE